MRLIIALRSTLLCAALVSGCSTAPEPVPKTRDNGPSKTDETKDPSDDASDATDDSEGDTTASPAPAKRDAGRAADAGKSSTDAGSVTLKDAGKSAPDAGSVGDASVGDASVVATHDADVHDGGPTPPPPVGDSNTAAGFVNLAPALGEPLDRAAGTPLTPAAPTGWVWYAIDGAVCRDGSPTGFYVHYADSPDLLLYLEGGGACTSPGFCSYNPKSVNQVLSGDGQTLLGSVGGATTGRQQPGKDGVFAFGNNANPFKSWSQIYVPYCTGDVHFGTRTDGKVAGVDGVQQFVGYRNMEKFLARIVPTFKERVKRVVLTGASAGGFGTALNYSLVQDTFGDSARVLGLDDSGPPFPDTIEPVCMQKKWRELFGFAGAFPKDCVECQQADGGGLINYADFLRKKHPHYAMAVVSSTQDEVIRAFYAPGLNNCSGFDTGDPAGAVLSSFPADRYASGLTALRAKFVGTGAFASYFINGGSNKTFHQHIWRPRFYEAAQGSTTIAAWVTDYLNGKMGQIGP